jgi:hypothetical protein
MDKDIMMICTLAACTEEVAREAYNRTNGDLLMAVDSILFPNTAPPPTKKHKREDINEHEEYLNKMRKTMEDFDAQVEKRQSTTSNPLADAESVEMLDHREETVQQSNCLPECHQPSFEEVVQTQGTVCR